MNPTAILYSLTALASVPGPRTTPPAEPQEATVPFEVEEHGGIVRPMIVASFNGHPIRMIVHSNAGFYSQLLHRDAATAGVVLTGQHSSFGIDKLGHVSKLGRDRGTVATLSVGGSVVHDAAVAVFELPIGADEHFGMLGLGWIRQNRVMLDYANHKVLVAPGEDHSKAFRSRLLQSGYTALPMTYESKSQLYTVVATINGVKRQMTVTTASPFSLDTGFATAAKIRFGKQDGHGFGPTGLQVNEYLLAEPVRVSIGAWTSPPIATGMIMDDYGYSGIARPADPDLTNGGTLGSAFLQETKAVIDFGGGTLFVHG